MAFGANSLLDMGRLALFTSQVQLQVTGDNIANVNTEGYARRTVVQQEGNYIDYSPGQIGTGVEASEIIRNFDEMVESMYLEQSSLSDKWGELWEQLQSVESVLNEASGNGISDALSQYFNSWNDLSQRPDDYSTRQTLLNDTTNLITTLNQADSDMATMQQRINASVVSQVDEANSLIEQIADLNKEISIHHVEGSNNANVLFDERARKVRELSELIDVKTIDNGAGEFSVMTQAGHTLVDGTSRFELAYRASGVSTQLEIDSEFEGSVYFEGTDDFEYTLEFVASSAGADMAGVAGSGAGGAMFKVSMDGGTSWLTDADGDIKYFSAQDYDSRVTVEGLDIWFGSNGNSKGLFSGQFAAGDRFVITPHQSLYWVENTAHEENITPQVSFNGEVDTSRLTGGSIAAMLEFRDSYVGKYREKLEKLTESLVWETNRRHSQGAGLQKFSQVTGSYQVNDTTKALASDSTGLTYGDRLQSGSSFFYVYNKSSGLLTSSAALDFGGGDTFNPAIHSLEDVEDAFNNTFSGTVTASIVNNKLVLEAEDGYEFAFGTDTSGLMAALGVNTFFTGSEPLDIAVNTTITGDIDFLATGHVNGAGEVNAGDNSTALSMFELRDTEITISTVNEGTTQASLLDFYNSLVANVGADTNKAEFNQSFYGTLASDLDERQQQVAGVNLDEEMSNLIKYQASYTAAAKLISTADEMLQTILSLKS